MIQMGKKGKERKRKRNENAKQNYNYPEKKIKASEDSTTVIQQDSTNDLGCGIVRNSNQFSYIFKE